MGDSENGDAKDKKNLAILVNRAIEESNPLSLNDPNKHLHLAETNPTQVAQRLSSWGVVYSVLGDIESGKAVFEKGLGKIFSYEHNYHREVLSLWKRINREEPFAKVPRQDIVNMPPEDFNF